MFHVNQKLDESHVWQRNLTENLVSKPPIYDMSPVLVNYLIANC